MGRNQKFSAGQCLKTASVPVGVAALFLLTSAANDCWAAPTGTSWNSNEPSWASSEPSRRSAGSSRESHDSRGQISPYSPGSNNLALDVGQIFLMGDLAGEFNDNIGGQLHYTYGVSDLFGFDTSVGYSEHSDGKFSMASLLAGLRTNLAWYDKVVPYAIFGLGFYKPSYTIISGSGADQTRTDLSPILFGVHLGAGIDLELTREIFFGAALTFHDVFGSERNTTNGIKDVGGTYTSFLLHAGVTF